MGPFESHTLHPARGADHMPGDEAEGDAHADAEFGPAGILMGDDPFFLFRRTEAHQKDIGVFTQRGPECVREGLGVDMHLALIDEAVFSLMHKLDGIFDGDDVVLAVSVDEINEGAEGRGLAGPRGGR